MIRAVVEFDPNNFAKVLFPSLAGIFLAILALWKWASLHPDRVVAAANELLETSGGLGDRLRKENERLAANVDEALLKHDALHARLDTIQQEMRDTLARSSTKIAELKWEVEQGALDRKIMARQIDAQTTHIELLEKSMRAAGITVPPRPF